MAEDTRSGKASSPVTGADIRTFLFADMRGYTRFTQEHGDDAASALAGRFADLVREAVPAFEGELLELRGDEALCVFRSARQALRASVELQRRLRTATDEEAVFPIGVGMGLDAGEAVPTQGGYRGASLNLAARLCALAKPGEILVSETVIGLASRVDGVRFGVRRSVRVKGFADPARVAVVVPDVPLPPVPVVPSSIDRRRSRRRMLAVGLVAALVVVLAVAEFGTAGHSGAVAPPSLPVHPNSVAVTDRAGHRVIADVPVGQIPAAIAIGFGDAWVANQGDNTVSRIDLKTEHVTDTVPLPGSPSGIATGIGFVWAFDNSTGRIYQIAPVQDQIVGRYRLLACAPPAGHQYGGGCPFAGMAVGYGRVWVDDGLSTVFALNPATDRFQKVRATLPAWALAVGNGSVYSADITDMASIAPGSPPISQRVQHVLSNEGGGLWPISIAAGSNTVWVVSSLGDVVRLDPNLATIKLVSEHPGTIAIAFGDGSVWVTNVETHVLLRIGAQDLHTLSSLRLGSPAPTSVAFGAGHAWVTLDTPAQVPRRQ